MDAQRLRKMAGIPWNEEENAIVRRYYAEHLGTKWLKEQLARRGLRAIYLHARTLGITHNRSWAHGKVWDPGNCVDCGFPLPVPRTGRTKRCVDCGKEWRDRIKTREYMRALRREALDHYGRVCACCGETHEEFLEIDHIANDGADERRKLRARRVGGNGRKTNYPYAFYRHLRQLGFPRDRYRTLCSNCNVSRGRYGYCPHERERAASA
jgi:hypothetical protein